MLLITRRIVTKRKEWQPSHASIERHEQISWWPQATRDEIYSGHRSKVTPGSSAIAQDKITAFRKCWTYIRKWEVGDLILSYNEKDKKLTRRWVIKKIWMKTVTVFLLCLIKTVFNKWAAKETQDDRSNWQNYTLDNWRLKQKKLFCPSNSIKDVTNNFRSNRSVQNWNIYTMVLNISQSCL